MALTENQRIVKERTESSSETESPDVTPQVTVNIVPTSQDLNDLLKWKPLNELLNPTAWEHLQVIILLRMLIEERKACALPQPPNGVPTEISAE